jgi:hypothetical protein
MRTLPDVRPGNEFQGAIAKHSLGVFAKKNRCATRGIYPTAGLGLYRSGRLHGIRIWFCAHSSRSCAIAKKILASPECQCDVKVWAQELPGARPTKQRK